MKWILEEIYRVSIKSLYNLKNYFFFKPALHVTQKTSPTCDSYSCTTYVSHKYGLDIFGYDLSTDRARELLEPYKDVFWFQWKEMEKF